MDYTSRHFFAYTKSTYYAVRPHLIFNLASYLAWKVLCLRLCVWCRHGTPSLTLLASDPLLITHTCLPSVSSICMISTSYCTHLRPWCSYPYWSCDLIVPCLFFYLHANCVSFPVLQNHYLPSGRPTAWTLSNHLATNPSQPTPSSSIDLPCSEKIPPYLAIHLALCLSHLLFPSFHLHSLSVLPINPLNLFYFWVCFCVSGQPNHNINCIVLDTQPPASQGQLRQGHCGCAGKSPSLAVLTITHTHDHKWRSNWKWLTDLDQQERYGIILQGDVVS